MSVIDFRGVSKSYPVYNSPFDRLKELATLSSRTYHQDFWAIRDVTLSVDRGETFCIVGENGSGKSTLMQIIARILHPTCGTAEVKGRVAALLELGSGFNPEFTGRDNVYLNASILGLSSREIDARYPEMEAFAEIGAFIDQPVKTYSTGMHIRLAFAVAIHVDPEILLVDEALSVGDVYFRQRCLRKVQELRSCGATIVFVSHSASDVKAVGDRCLWLDHGRVREIGSTETVVSNYLAEMDRKDSAYLNSDPLDHPGNHAGAITGQLPEIHTHIPNVDRRNGDGNAEILGIAVFDTQGREVRMLEPSTRIIIGISAQAKGNLALPVIGFILRNHLGLDFAGTSTTREGRILPSMRPGDITTAEFHIDLPELYAGSFSLSPGIADGAWEESTMCDWIDNAIILPMSRGKSEIYGYLQIPCQVEVNARLGKANQEPHAGAA